MKNGILIINKEKGMTSRDVVNVVCGKLKTKHIGHTGTLDPIATGVLVLGVNNGCKIIELLTSDDKIYEAEVIVGLETDTLDITGKILNTYNIENIDIDDIKKVLSSFKGKYLQEVPKYSAVHVNGKRLHEYARNNEEVVLPKREVEIYDINLIDDIKQEDNYFTFKFLVHVSKGTYIRSLIRDIGNKLGISCTMKNLKRIKQGNFKIEDAINLEDVSIDTNLATIKDALTNYEKIIVDDNVAKKVKNGMILEFDTKSEIVLILDNNNDLLAIYKRYQKDPKKMKPYKVFNEV